MDLRWLDFIHTYRHLDFKARTQDASLATRRCSAIVGAVFGRRSALLVIRRCDLSIGLSFTEASIYVLAWGSVALLYQWRARVSTSLSHFYRVLAQLHGLAALALYVGYLLLSSNPWWASPELGTKPIWNGLLLGYGLPTLLLTAVVWQAKPAGWPAKYQRIAAIAAAVNGWFFVSLQIRHLW